MSVSGVRFLAVSLVCVGTAIGSAAVATCIDSLRRFEAALVREQPAVTATVELAAVLSNDEWTNSLRSEQSWSKRRSGTPAASSSKSGQTKTGGPALLAPSGLFGGLFESDPDMPLPPLTAAPSGTFRTVCVRTCDGYFYPVSFATTRDRFSAVEAKCQNSCSADARLYVYRNPGAEPDSMVDLSGRPYSKLKTAFLYRTAYDANCKCNAHPWEQEARTKHRVFALEAERRKGNKKVVAELKELKSAMGNTAQAANTGKRRTPKLTATATVTPAPAVPVPAQALIDAPAAGSLKMADPALLPPTAPKTRVAEGTKPMQKAMRLGAPQPAASSTGGEWKRRSLSDGM